MGDLSITYFVNGMAYTSNEYIKKLRKDLCALQRQQGELMSFTNRLRKIIEIYEGQMLFEDHEWPLVVASEKEPPKWVQDTPAVSALDAIFEQPTFMKGK